jgi:hypothetical protein
VVSPETWYFSIKSPDLQTTYYSGELSSQKYWTSSGENLKIADFSGFTEREPMWFMLMGLVLPILSALGMISTVLCHGGLSELSIIREHLRLCLPNMPDLAKRWRSF